MSSSTKDPKPTTIAAAAAATAASTNTPQFFIVYASLGEDGVSWCGDCRAAEPFVEKKFGGKGGLELGVYYAGDRET